MLKQMKRGFFSGLLLLSFFCSVDAVNAQKENQELLNPPQQQEESFAKWGTKAVETVKKKYPDSKLSDYEYLGTNSTKVQEWQDNFHIVTSKEGKKKLLRATVSYNPKTQQLNKVDIKEEKCE